jgi:hypothetical protein
VPYLVRDIAHDPEARAELTSLGFNTVPVAAIGDRTLHLYHVDQLREWLGLDPGEVEPDYPELVAACGRVLEAFERALRQVPDQHLGTLLPQGEDIRELAATMQARAAWMVEALDGAPFTRPGNADSARMRSATSGAQLADPIGRVRPRWLERARRVPQDDLGRSVRTSQDVALTVYQLTDFFARSCAGKLRQTYAFLREHGVEPEQELSTDDMAPIPLTTSVQ